MTNTDVGGNQQIEQIYMITHGSRRTDTTLQVDGMSINSLMNDGEVQAYFSDAANAEVTYQTSGVGAEVSTGGVKINMIPREGGNRFSGSAFVGRQLRQVAERQRDRRAAAPRPGAGQPRGSHRGHQLRTRRADQEGFAVVLRHAGAGSPRTTSWPNTTFKDGSQGRQEQWVQNQLVRLTWQISPRNKFTVYHDRYPKFKSYEMGALYEPETAAYRRDPNRALYYTGQAKWTSPVTNRLLLEAGYSTNVEYVTIHYQPGVAQDRGSPAWFNTIGKQDLLLGTSYDGVHGADIRHRSEEVHGRPAPPLT